MSGNKEPDMIQRLLDKYKEDEKNLAILDLILSGDDWRERKLNKNHKAFYMQIDTLGD